MISDVAFLYVRRNVPTAVIAGLDPAIPINGARRCPDDRGGRVKPGHDESVKAD
jgi:hypothetical protein